MMKENIICVGELSCKKIWLLKNIKVTKLMCKAFPLFTKLVLATLLCTDCTSNFYKCSFKQLLIKTGELWMTCLAFHGPRIYKVDFILWPALSVWFITTRTLFVPKLLLVRSSALKLRYPYLLCYILFLICVHKPQLNNLQMLTNWQLLYKLITLRKQTLRGINRRH